MGQRGDMRGKQPLGVGPLGFVFNFRPVNLFYFFFFFEHKDTDDGAQRKTFKMSD